MEGGGGRGVGDKKVYLMLKISEYLLHIVLLLKKRLLSIWSREFQ